MVGLVIAQRRVIHDVRRDLSFRFIHYVFDGPEFPKGDFDDGRLVHRALFPSRFTTTFYDAQYQEVKQADKPGRYGAVVRLNLNGTEVQRFITLYRTPAKIYWLDTPWTVSAQLPPEIGLNPTVLSAQQPEIGKMLKNALVGNGDSPQLAILLAGLSEMSPSDPPAVERTGVVARDTEWWNGLRERLGLATTYHYLIDLPRDYNADPQKKWPLIFYIHAGQEQGDNLHLVRRSGLAHVIDDGKQVPAIVLSPQCPDKEEWNSKALLRLLDEISQKYRVDADRIYVTGGSEVWELAEAYPERFAAINPLCGECDPADAARLKDLPVWAFYGTEQESSSMAQTNAMLDSIRKAGGHPHLTLSDGHHDTWDMAYATDALYKWLLAQKRGQPEAVTPGVPTP